MDENILQTEIDRFKLFLRSRHLRKTPERFEILKAVLFYPGHFDVDALYRMLEKQGYHVSKATVYSTLELLCDCGIIRKLLFDTHQAKYEKAEKAHCHLICTRCGQIKEIETDDFERQAARMSIAGFSPSYVSTCIYGICHECNSTKTYSDL